MLEKIKSVLKYKTTSFLKLVGEDPQSDFFEYIKEFSPFLIFMIASNILGLFTVCMTLPLGYNVLVMPVLVIFVSFGLFLHILFEDFFSGLVNSLGYSKLLKIAIGLLLLSGFIMISELGILSLFFVIIFANIGLFLLVKSNDGYFLQHTPAKFKNKLGLFKTISIFVAGLLFLRVSNLPSFFIGIFVIFISIFNLVLVLLLSEDDHKFIKPVFDYKNIIKQSIKKLNFDTYIKSCSGSWLATVYFIITVSFQNISTGVEVNKLLFFVNLFLIIGGTALFFYYVPKQNRKVIDIEFIFGAIVSLIIAGFAYAIGGSTTVAVIGILTLGVNIFLSKKHSQD